MNARSRLLVDLGQNPAAHLHSHDALLACCTINGTVDRTVLERHHRIAAGGGSTDGFCDAVEGPCGCGAWHVVPRAS